MNFFTTMRTIVLKNVYVKKYFRLWFVMLKSIMNILKVLSIMLVKMRLVGLDAIKIMKEREDHEYIKR